MKELIAFVIEHGGQIVFESSVVRGSFLMRIDMTFNGEPFHVTRAILFDNVDEMIACEARYLLERLRRTEVDAKPT